MSLIRVCPSTLNVHCSVTLAQIDMAVRSGLRMICICLTSDVHASGQPGFDPWLGPESPLDSRTQTMFDRVIELHPQALFVIRFYAQQPEFESIVMLNLNNSEPTILNNQSNLMGDDMNSITEDWVASAAAKLTTMLTYLDQQFPGRIAAVFPCFFAYVRVVHAWAVRCWNWRCE